MASPRPRPPAGLDTSPAAGFRASVSLGWPRGSRCALPGPAEAVSVQKEPSPPPPVECRQAVPSQLLQEGLRFRKVSRGAGAQIRFWVPRGPGCGLKGIPPPEARPRLRGHPAGPDE